MTALQYVGIGMIAAPFIAAFVGAVMTIGVRGALGVFGLAGGIFALIVVGTALVGVPP